MCESLRQCQATVSAYYLVSRGDGMCVCASVAEQPLDWYPYAPPMVNENVDSTVVSYQSKGVLSLQQMR